MKRQHYSPPLTTLLNLRAPARAAAVGSRYFIFHFSFPAPLNPQAASSAPAARWRNPRRRRKRKLVQPAGGMALSAKGKAKGRHRAYIQQAIATTGSSAGSGEPSIRGGRQIREAIMTQFRAALTARDTGQRLSNVHLKESWHNEASPGCRDGGPRRTRTASRRTPARRRA